MTARRIGYALWLLAAAALYFFENNTGTRAVLVSSAAVPVFSLCCAAWTAKKASCRLEGKKTAAKGEKCSCYCFFSGPWTRLGCVLSCRVVSKHRMNHQTERWEKINSGGEDAVLLNCTHCGAIDIRVEKAEARDWLGLASFPCPAIDSVSLLILPDLYPVRVHLSEQLSLPWQEERPGQPQRHAWDTETSGVRDYVPGDPVRRIHWKLSGKMDRVLIREEDRPFAGNVLLLLENSGYGIDPEDMDSAAEAMLSVSRTLAEEGIVHCAGWLDRGSVQWMEIGNARDFLSMRDALLSAQAEEAGESIGAAFSRAFPDLRADHAFVFSPRPDTDAISLLENCPVTLVLPRDTGENPDLRVVCLSREHPELDL